MSSITKIAYGGVILTVVLAASFAIYTRNHWWIRVGTAEIQPPSTHSRVIVYRSINNELLLEVIEDSLLSIYIFYPKTNLIGMPNHGQFIILPGVAYSKDFPAPAVYSNSAKIETDLNISVDNEVLQFDHKGRRIVADLKGY